MRYILAVLAIFFCSTCFALEIKSSAFNNGAEIETRYSCDADNISPALSWSGAPQGTKNFVLICEDPDSPSKVWSHWVVFNMPASKTGLDEGMPTTGTFDDGTVQGINDFGKPGYFGPCPPPTGQHRYFFRIYAIDTTLDLDEGATRDIVLSAISGHILAQAEIFGTYQR